MTNNTRVRAGLVLIATLAVAACGSSAPVAPPVTVAPATTVAPIASSSAKGAGAYDLGVASAKPAVTAAPVATSAPAAGGGATLSIANFAFDPATLKVKVGTTVTWTNNDGATHTVTAGDGSFDSGRLASGATFNFTFSTAGTYTYHCAIHSSMTGTVTVSS